MARDLVLKAPPEIAVNECGCRHRRAHPCQPTQVCMVVGQPFVDFILEHHPKTSAADAGRGRGALESRTQARACALRLVQRHLPEPPLCPVQLL